MMNRFFTALVAASLLFIVGCSDDNSSNPDDAPATIRLLHNVYDGNGLDLRVNNVIVAENVTYNTSSGYRQVAPAVAPNQATVSVHYTGDANARNSSKQTLGPGLAYTVYAFPPAAAFSAGFQNDPRETSPSNARIKFVNATSDTFKFELWVTGAKSRLLGPLNRTQVAQYIDVPFGSYRFSIKKQGDTAFSREYEAVSLVAQGAYTIVMHGTLSDADAYPFSVRMYTDNGPGTAFVDWVKASSTGKVLFAHAVQGGAAASIAVDVPSPQITGLAFGSATSYLTFGAGQHIFSAAAGSTTIVSNSTFNIETAKSYSMFLTGTMTPLATQPLYLEDVTSPNLSQAMVRFVNLAPDAPSIEIGVKEIAGYVIPMAAPLGFRQVSLSETSGSNFLMIPPGTYTLQYIDATTKAVLLEQGNQTFTAGLIYTNWFGGSAAAKSLKAYNIKHN